MRILGGLICREMRCVCLALRVADRTCDIGVVLFPSGFYRVVFFVERGLEILRYSRAEGMTRIFALFPN